MHTLKVHKVGNSLNLRLPGLPPMRCASGKATSSI